jgi:PAS domain-containing protein
MIPKLLPFAALLAFALIAPEGIAAAPARDPLHIDLNESPLYATVGFDLKTLTTIPANGAPGWKAIPPAGPAGRTVRPGELGFPGLPKRAPFSLSVYPTMEFTYLIPFQVSPAMAALLRADSPKDGGASRVAGMHFAGIGDNWQIYLNGKLIRSEMHLAPDGTVVRHSALRNRHFPVDSRYFLEGSNVLAIRIVADPTYLPSGLTQASPFYIGDYERIDAANAEIWPMILIGLYLFIGLYHLFMFLVRTRDRHNLFYGLFSLDLGFYLLMRTYTITRILSDSDLIFRIEIFTLCFILPLVGAFLETLHDGKIKKTTLGYGAFCALIGLGELSTPIAFAYDLLRVWQASGVIMAFYYFGVDILGRFLTDTLRRWKRERGTADGRSLAQIQMKALVRTPIGNLVIGGIILFGTGIFDIIDAVFMQWDLVLTKYGFFLFTMGTAFILANRLGFLQDRLSGLNKTLEERISVLTETGARLTASERRYRSLFEGSAEPVALLTEELGFIEGNHAATELFGLDRAGGAPSTLFDAVYADKREGSLPIEFLRAASKSLRDKVVPSEILLRIKAPIGEPRPCKLRLERIDDLERKEVLLRVMPEEKDLLAGAFVEGRERFDVESSLSAADTVCRRATAYLSRYADEEEARFLASCLREIVINAVEHGNLRIGFDEKSVSMREGRYFELLQERRMDPRYRTLRVVVEYSVSAARATFRVTDEGSGFDHRKYAKGMGDEPDMELLEHGRGLFITMNAFDKVFFNEAGNQVTLVKFFAGSGASRGESTN